MIRYFFFMILLAFVSCTKKGRKTLVIGNVKAVGAIGPDSTYDGLVNFYDLGTNQLLYSSHYKENILNGEQVIFYPNGKPQYIQNYTNGELNGYTNFYDSAGNLFSKQYTYYGVKSGHHLNLYLNAPKEYGFYSLENELLFYVNYDSLKVKKITDIETLYFFYQTRDISNLSETALVKGTEFFVYLPEPPRCKFEYSIVQVDSLYKIVSVDKVFDNNKIWSTFTYNEKPDGIVAIRLTITDSTRDNETYKMFRKVIF